MAKHVLIVCDLADASCTGDVITYKLWRDEEARARSIDICETHSKPLLEMFSAGHNEPLPPRPRQKMEPTKLKTTKQTRQLKRPKPS